MLEANTAYKRRETIKIECGNPDCKKIFKVKESLPWRVYHNKRCYMKHLTTNGRVKEYRCIKKNLIL